MHDPHVVGHRQSGEGLPKEIDDPRRSEQLAAVNELEERATVEELHGDVAEPRVLSVIEHAHGVRMVETGRGLGLALKSSGKCRVAVEIAMQDLDGHELVEGRLAGAVNGAHGASAQIR